MRDSQIRKLIRAHLPIGGFAHIQETSLQTAITLVLNNDKVIRFNIDRRVVEEDTVTSRLLIRNTVKSAIAELVKHGTSLPAK